MFPCAEIGVTPLDFQILTSLSIDQYPTQVSYDDAWSVLSNARQLLPNIKSSNIKSENVNISHLMTYLTITGDREDDITIAHAFIFFMMGHLWFQTANNVVLLGYLAAVADLNEVAEYDWGYAIIASMYHGLDTAYWFYEYYGVGHPIVKEEVDTTLTTGLLRRSPGDLNWILRFPKDGEYRSARTHCTHGRITPVVVTLAPVHSLSQDFSLPGEPERSDPGWHMEWTGRREMFLIHCLRNPPPMSASYSADELWYLTYGMRRFCLAESAWDAQRIQKLTDKNATLRRHMDSVDDQLYSHDLHLRRGRDVRVVPLPPGGGARTRQGNRRLGPRTKGGGTSRRGRGTGDDFGPSQ
ncbi:hypothetical protein GIB67_029339 [Kingdonia uniflora]|uniref:Aminotransferase-like plant mobile domain-containing protein n=1 Tax=Kingdonia uniflora TaxID=39325 RepID=A0A7J7N906_9MAGN|nr:hypothetical protein GIB67_029339 [Kingdonia uniflora]